METVDYAMYAKKEKNFDDALDFAIQKRKFLIAQASEKAIKLACKAGRTWAMQEYRIDEEQ